MSNVTVISNILHAAQWTPVQRLVALDVALSAQRRPDSQHYVLDVDSSATAIAQRLGISLRSASDALHALDNAGVIAWQRECRPDGAKNRYGESIPVTRASRERGDYIAWQHTSIVSMPVDVAIPESLPASPNVERSRTRAAVERQRVRQMQDDLQRLLNERACPTCDAHGTLHADVRATCSACGTIYSADELDAMLSTPVAPELDVLQADDASDAPTNVKTFHISASLECENFSHSEGADALKEESGATLDAERDAFPVDYSQVDDVLSDVELDVLDLDDELDALRVECENFSHGCDDALPDVPDELTGTDSILYLASLGVGAFCRSHVLHGKKAGYGHDFLSVPASSSDAIAHLRRAAHHLVGVLPEHCAYDVLDVDAGLDEFMRSVAHLHPDVRSWARVIRHNAPERAKFIYKVRDAGARLRHTVRESSDKTRKVELIGARHSAVIAGLHPSGVPYTLVTGVIPELDASQVQAIIDAFVPAVPAVPTQRSASRSASNVKSFHGATCAKKAITFWLAQPENVAKTLALIDAQPHAGRHFRLRAEDENPSVMLTSDDAVHDYGDEKGLSNGHYDLFEVWCRLTNTNKRAAIHDAWLQFRASQVGR